MIETSLLGVLAVAILLRLAIAVAPFIAAQRGRVSVWVFFGVLLAMMFVAVFGHAVVVIFKLEGLAL